jgi:hypothetical protein
MTEKLCKFAAILTYQLVQRPVLRVPEIKVEKSARGLVCHQQPVILVNNNDGISNTVNNRFSILFAFLGELNLNPQILDLLFVLRSARSTVVKMLTDSLAQFVHFGQFEASQDSRASAAITCSFVLKKPGYGRDCPGQLEPVPAEQDHAHSHNGTADQCNGYPLHIAGKTPTLFRARVLPLREGPYEQAARHKRRDCCV